MSFEAETLCPRCIEDITGGQARFRAKRYLHGDEEVVAFCFGWEEQPYWMSKIHIHVVEISKRMIVYLPEGEVTLHRGDYLIKDSAGKLYTHMDTNYDFDKYYKRIGD